MNNNFDIEKLSRKMPYTVPESFFEQSFQRIMEATVNDKKRKKRKFRIITLMTSITAAAAVTMAAVFAMQRELPAENNTINETHINAHIDNMLENIGDEELSNWVEYTDPNMYLASY